jgi:hypothetical protein
MLQYFDKAGKATPRNGNRTGGEIQLSQVAMVV